MSYEEEFDRIIRHKAEETEYPFEEASWEKVKGALGGRRRESPALVKSLLVTGIVVVAGGIGTLLWFGQPDEPVAERQVHRELQQPAEKDRIAGQVAVPVTKIEDPASTESNSKAKPRVSHSAVAKQPTEKMLPNDIAASSAPGHTDQTGSVGQSPEKPGRVGSNGRFSVNLSPVVPVSDEKGETGPATAQPVEEPETEAVEVAGERIENLVAKHLLIPFSPEEREATPGAVANPRRDDDYVSDQPVRGRLFVDALGGAAFHTGWRSGSTYEGRGVNWYGGIAVGFATSGGWEFGTGAQLFNLAHLDAPFYEATAKSYGFGSIETTTTIATRELRYLGVPLRVSRVLPGGGKISLGIIGAQLWQASSKITVATSNDEQKASENTKNSTHLYEGMNQQALMVTAGYAVKVSNRLYAGADVVYGVTDLFSARTYLRRSERPLLIRAGLTFRLIEK